MTKSKIAKKTNASVKNVKSARPIARKKLKARPTARKSTLSAMIAKGVKNLTGKPTRSAAK